MRTAWRAGRFGNQVLALAGVGNGGNPAAQHVHVVRVQLQGRQRSKYFFENQALHHCHLMS